MSEQDQIDKLWTELGRVDREVASFIGISKERDKSLFHKIEEISGRQEQMIQTLQTVQVSSASMDAAFKSLFKEGGQIQQLQSRITTIEQQGCMFRFMKGRGTNGKVETPPVITDARMFSVEKKIWFATGAVAAAGVLLGSLITVLLWALNHYDKVQLIMK